MLAHYDKNTGKEQQLKEHLLNVALEAKKNAEEINQGYVLFLIGLYHDLGKSDRLFQHMMLNQTKDKIDHSSAGAKYLYNEIYSVLSSFKSAEKDLGHAQSFVEIICYVVSAHHGVYDIPLFDEDEIGNSRLIKRIIYDKHTRYHFEEDVLPFADELKTHIHHSLNMSLPQLIVYAYDEYISLLNKLKWNDIEEKYFYQTLIVRLYLSLLKNADILDTINAYETIISPMTVDTYSKLGVQYLSAIEKLYYSYRNPSNNLNQVRTNLAEVVKIRGEVDGPGIYRLDLPTGSGKTNLSMRYGFHQLAINKKKRFIYITPYLSVLEQNAHHIRSVLGNDVEGVLEHHSNVIDTDSETSDEKEKVMREYLVDTWDHPIILSSMVQLFQTFFKNKSSNIRRFSNLINSVLILDEVQSLPVDVTSLFNLTINFLSQVMNVNVILCTATQPVYNSKYIKHKVQYGGSCKESHDIVKLTEKDREIFKRTEIYKFKEDDYYSTLEEIATAIEKYKDDSVLVILNTKAAVRKLYYLLQNRTNRSCYHLSTNMCAKHRLDIIGKIKTNINDEPLVCVSTQLIEAGVDLDFNRVIRSYSGIDSIVQASGRCNREGKKDKGIVELVNVDSEQEKLTSSALKAIRLKKEVTEKIISKLVSPIDLEKLNDEFFERYYANTDEKSFDYVIEKDKPTIFDMLSTNGEYGVMVRTYLKQSIKSAGLKMDLIQKETKGVIVYYHDNHQKIEELIESIRRFEVYYKQDDLEMIKKLTKELQPYTININDTDELQKGIMKYQNGYIQVLQEQHYDKNIGAIEDTVFIF